MPFFLYHSRRQASLGDEMNDSSSTAARRSAHSRLRLAATARASTTRRAKAPEQEHFEMPYIYRRAPRYFLATPRMSKSDEHATPTGHRYFLVKHFAGFLDVIMPSPVSGRDFQLMILEISFISSLWQYQPHYAARPRSGRKPGLYSAVLPRADRASAHGIYSARGCAVGFSPRCRNACRDITTHGYD